MSLNAGHSNGSRNAADERTPLITATDASLGPNGPAAETAEEPLLSNGISGAVSKDDGVEEENEDKPLPKGQIFLLCFARAVEPICFFSIFPFVNQMIRDTSNGDEADVGFYSGLIESLFSLTQMCVMVGWGRLSDRYGRKPVLVFSLAGMSLAMSLFGLSKQVWQMILFRCIAGVFAGSGITIRTMIAEHCTPKTQAWAFSFFGFASNIGIFIGPFIGGGLAEPARTMPKIFGKIHLFVEYPYALPSFAIGVVGVASAIVCAIFVQETLVRKEDAPGSKPQPPMSTRELLQSPGVATVLWIYSLVTLTAIAYTAIVTLFWFTSVSLGGLGLTPFEISVFLGVTGAAQTLWSLFAFAPLHARFGTGTILRSISYVWPLFFLINPICNGLRRNHLDTLFWVFGPVSLAIGSCVSMSFTGVQLALNDIAPSPNTLGTLNALALMVVSGLRAVGPALFTSIFAASARSQFLKANLIWLILMALASIFAVVVRWLPEKAEGKPKRRTENQTEENGASV